MRLEGPAEAIRGYENVEFIIQELCHLIEL
jgi:hypothetical protein